MYLDRILGSKTKINILAALVKNPERTFMESELAKEIGYSVSEVNRQMADLVNCGLVRMERTGKAKLYNINARHFLFSSLRTLFRDLNGVYREAASKIVKAIAKRYKPISIILFGSLAKGRIRGDLVSNPSDIDLMIIVEKTKVEEVKEIVRNLIDHEITTKYGIIAYPIVLSPEEYRKRLADDQFIIDIHANGEILYGEKPRRFG